MLRAFLLLLFSTMYSVDSHAYLDPASGNALASFFIALFSSAVFFIKSLYYKIISSSRAYTLPDKKVSDASKLPLVFSEGEMYWTTFRPIVE